MTVTSRVQMAKGIKEVVKVPVMGAGNITEHEYTDSMIGEDKVDLVAVGCTLLPNPDFPKQAAQKLGIKL